MSTEPHQDTAGDVTTPIGAVRLDFTEGSRRSGDGPTVATVAPPIEVTATEPTAGGAYRDRDPDDGSQSEAQPQPKVEPSVKLPPPPLPVPRSSLSRRFGALVLELVLVATTMFVGWFVWSLRTWARGQTPAMSLLSMRCVRIETAKAANWRTMALREGIGKGLLTLVTVGITVVVSAVRILGPSRQGLWDRMAGTTVVDDPDGVTR